jgi:hypothetical protein
MAGFVSLNCVAAESRDILFIDKLFPYIYIRFKKSCSEWLDFFWELCCSYVRDRCSSCFCTNSTSTFSLTFAFGVRVNPSGNGFMTEKRHSCEQNYTKMTKGPSTNLF